MINPRLGVVPGDLELSRFEDKLSDAWPHCHNRDESAFRTMTAFYRLIQSATEWGAELALIDIGPNLGAINRSALIASDQVCLPLAPDLFSLQGLKNLGPTLRDWRSIWNELLTKAPSNLPMPKGAMQPVGYIVMQHGIRDSRPVKAYQCWMERIPETYRVAVLDERPTLTLTAIKLSESLLITMLFLSTMEIQQDSGGSFLTGRTALRTCASRMGQKQHGQPLDQGLGV